MPTKKKITNDELDKFLVSCSVNFTLNEILGDIRRDGYLIKKKQVEHSIARLLNSKQILLDGVVCPCETEGLEETVFRPFSVKELTAEDCAV